MKLIDSEVLYCHNEYNWRLGQAYFNVLNTYYPKIAEQIRATEFDCFYDDSKIEIFKQKIKEIDILFELDCVMVDDIIQMILAEAGYENNKNNNFDYVNFCKILYKNYNNISILNDNISFSITGTYPYSRYIERVFARFTISGVFINGKLANDTKEFQKKNFEKLSENDKNEIIKIGNLLKLMEI